MAKPSKRSKTRRSSRSKSSSNVTNRSSSNGTNRLFKDGLSLASSLIDSRKEWGSEKLSEFASATQEYAASMKDIPVVEDTVSFAADTVEKFAKYISRTSVERLAADASRFVKRYPVAMIAAGVTVGLVAIVVASQSKISRLGRYGKANGRHRGVHSTRRPSTGTKNSNIGANIH